MKLLKRSFLMFVLAWATTSNAATYRVVRSYPNGKPKAGVENVLRFSLYRGNLTTALTAADLKLEHDKLIHLMALDSGFKGYMHEHPEEVSPGVWQVSLNMKIAGKYRIWMQFLPDGETATKLVFFDDAFLEFDGQIVPGAPADTSVKLTALEGAYKVNVSFPDGDPVQHQNVPMKFSFEKDGKVVPVEELDDYLGAKMHLAGISGDKKDFMHSHPGHPIEIDESMDSDTVNGHFMQEGYYGLFLQFKHLKVLHTVQFGITVKGHGGTP